MIETKDRILDAAERMFSEGGYQATSLRSIMAEAGVNVASVHYHFRSKEALLEAVLLRRLEPANVERLRALEEHERGAGRPTVEGVLHAFLAPTFRLATDTSQSGYAFVRLMGRLQAESDLLPQLVYTRFGPVLLRFADALARALPQLPPDELFLRSRLALGAAAQLLRDAPTMRRLSSGDAHGWEEAIAGLIAFLSAGFRAPLAQSQRVQTYATTNGSAHPAMKVRSKEAE